MNHALLISIASKQNFIFQNRKVKENMGASYILSELIFKTLKEEVIGKLNIKPIAENEGGGNLFLLFDENKDDLLKDDLSKFVEEWTKLLLVKAPGVLPQIADCEFDITKYPEEIKKLNQKLKENKSRYIPNIQFPSHGITNTCVRSGFSSEIWFDKTKEETEKSYVSSSSYSKLLYSKPAKAKFLKDFQVNNKYTFTDEIEKFSGEDGYIAIVHIDGNGMGERFQNCNTFEEYIKLSESSENKIKEAFQKIVSYSESHYEEIMSYLGIDAKDYPKDDEDNGRFILPIIPIIFGGDDVTFLSEGKLGIFFAEMFIKHLSVSPLSDNKPMTACAGVSIIKKKYPFYRGYEMAEDLCKNAKTNRKKQRDSEKQSWIDYQIFQGSIMGSLKEIRKKHFINSENKELYFKPYILDNNGIRGLKSLKSFSEELAKTSKNKYREIPQVLYKTESERKMYLKQMQFRDRDFPPKFAEQSFSKEDFFFEYGKENATSFIDAVELLEFYPFELSEKENA